MNMINFTLWWSVCGAVLGYVTQKIETA